MLSVTVGNINAALTWLADNTYSQPDRSKKVQETAKALGDLHKGVDLDTKNVTANDFALVIPCIEHAIYLVQLCKINDTIKVGALAPKSSSLVAAEATDFFRTLGRTACYIDATNIIAGNKKKWVQTLKLADHLLAITQPNTLKERIHACMSMYNSLPSGSTLSQDSAKAALWSKIVMACQKNEEEGPTIYRENIRSHCNPQVMGKQLASWKLEPSEVVKVCDHISCCLLSFDECSWAYYYAKIAAELNVTVSENIALNLMEAAIRDETLIYLDHILNYKCITSISSHPMVSMITAIVNFKEADVRENLQQNKDSWAKLKVTEAPIIRKMQIARIMSSGFVFENSSNSLVVKISDLTLAAGTSNDIETESLVAYAINKGILVGRIRQATDDVIIANSQPNKFNVDGYKTIQIELQKLIKAVDALQFTDA